METVADISRYLQHTYFFFFSFYILQYLVHTDRTLGVKNRSPRCAKPINSYEYL